MKRNLALGGLMALAFVGCGLIPPIDVGDALALNGKTTNIALTATGPASIQSTGTIGGATATFTFNDDPNINIPLTPSGFSYMVAISSVNFGSGCTLPGNTTVQIQNLKVVLSDPAFTDPTKQPSATASNLSFSVTPNGGAFIVNNLSGNELVFNNLGNIGAILKGGGTNTLTLSGNVSTNPSVGSCTLTITWGAGKGTVKL